MSSLQIINILIVLLSLDIVRIYVSPCGRTAAGKPICRHWLWCVLTGFQYYITLTEASNPLLILICNVLLVALIYLFTCGGYFRTALFKSGIFYVFWMAAEVVTQNLLLGMDIRSEDFFIMGSILSKIAMYALVRIYHRYHRRGDDTPFPQRYWLRLFLVPAVSAFVIYETYRLTLRNGSQGIFALMALLMVLINCVIFDVYDRMGAQVLTEQQNRAYETELSQCTKQAAEREAAYRQTSMLRHDLNDRLVGVDAFLAEGRLDDARKEIGRMLDENRLFRSGNIHSGNPALDSLINYKHSGAEAEDIRIECRLEIPPDMPVDGIDLCVIVGNLLDNAMEAVRVLPVNERCIRLNVRQDKGTVGIAVENPYSGRIREDADGWIRSSKPGNGHGFGLFSVSRTADRYNGKLTVRHEGGIFRAYVLLYITENLTS